MSEEIYLVAGTIILVVAIIDFLYTALSGSGCGPLAKASAAFSHRLLILGGHAFGRGLFATISGTVINLTPFVLWLLMLWTGLFCLFSSNPSAIINDSGNVASAVERIYFTGYVLSTLGVGNFYPASGLFEVLTSIGSFVGFIFFTTSITYFLSITSVNLHKRSLAMAVNCIGRSPAEVVTFLLNLSENMRQQHVTSFLQSVQRHTVNHQVYPLLHYYNTSDRQYALSVNIAILDEAVSLLYCGNDEKIAREVKPLRSSLNEYLRYVKEQYGHAADDVPEISLENIGPRDCSLNVNRDPSLSSRRKILMGLLKSENFGWEDVYTATNDKKEENKL